MPSAILGAALLDLGRTALTPWLACPKRWHARPTICTFREALATALENAGDADAALQVLTDGIALCPGSVSIRNAAICCASAAGISGRRCGWRNRLGPRGIADATHVRHEGPCAVQPGRARAGRRTPTRRRSSLVPKIPMCVIWWWHPARCRIQNARPKDTSEPSSTVMPTASKTTSSRWATASQARSATCC